MPFTSCPGCDQRVDFDLHEVHSELACQRCDVHFTITGGIIERADSKHTEMPPTPSSGSAPAMDYVQPRHGLPIGLIALGIVLGLVCLGAIVAFVVSMSGGGLVVIAVPPRDMRGSIPIESDNDLAGKLAAHAFWKSRVTPEMVLTTIEDLQRRQASSLLLIDDRFRTQLLNEANSDDQFFVSAYRHSRVILGLPKGSRLTDRFVVIDMNEFSTRPSRATLLEILKGKLDRAEFRMEK